MTERIDPRLETQVAIIGAGPAGTLLSHLLAAHDIDSVVLEQRSREYVLARIRAGVLEQGSANILRHYRLGDRMDREGHVHEGVSLAYRESLFRIDFKERTGSTIMVYGQTEVQHDLYAARDEAGGLIVDEAEDVALHDIDGDRPYVTYSRAGELHRLDCEYIAGCDGSHGISRLSVPETVSRTFEKEYPFGWLGILSETPPISEELIYANSERGFALCSMRHPMLSRYYLQCPLDTDMADWPDDRFWDELTRRLPDEVTPSLVTGPSIEKSIAPLSSFVAEPMRYERLLLAGDATHVFPPTGAKGLNAAISDVVYLARALVEYYENGSTTGIDAYSDTALTRVWKAIRFSWWWTMLMHRIPKDGAFGQRVQEAELEYLSTSTAAQTAMAENYVGLPL